MNKTLIKVFVLTTLFYKNLNDLIDSVRNNFGSIGLFTYTPILSSFEKTLNLLEGKMIDLCQKIRFQALNVYKDKVHSIMINKNITLHEFLSDINLKIFALACIDSEGVINEDEFIRMVEFKIDEQFNKTQ